MRVRTGKAPVIRDNSWQSRFELYDDGTLAGQADYEMRGNEMWVLRTSLSKEFTGSGLDLALMANLMHSAHRRRIAVLPFCPVARAFLSANRQPLGLIPATQRSRFTIPAPAGAE